MNILNRDYMIFGAFCFLCAMEGWLIGKAIETSPLPWFETALKFQWFVNIIIAFCAAGLAYCAAMQKTKQDAVHLEISQRGVTNAIDIQMYLMTLFTYDLTFRVMRNVNNLLDSPIVRAQVLGELNEIVKDGDNADNYFRENIRHAMPEAIDNLQNKYVTFRALLNDIKMAQKRMEGWTPNLERWQDEMDSVFWLLELLRNKMITMAFKYTDHTWQDWEAEAGKEIAHRDLRIAELRRENEERTAAEAAREQIA